VRIGLNPERYSKEIPKLAVDKIGICDKIWIQNQNSMLCAMYMIKEGQGFHHKQPIFSNNE
jgi:hypothetical protein